MDGNLAGRQTSGGEQSAWFAYMNAPQTNRDYHISIQKAERAAISDSCMTRHATALVYGVEAYATVFFKTVEMVVYGLLCRATLAVVRCDLAAALEILQTTGVEALHGIKLILLLPQP